MKKRSIKSLFAAAAAVCIAAVMPFAQGRTENAAFAERRAVSFAEESKQAQDEAEPADIWDGGIAESFGGGDGSENAPYLIENAGQLAFLAQQVNSGTSYDGEYFELTADIYLNDTSNRQSWDADTAPANQWTAIGLSYYDDSLGYRRVAPFGGIFDGGGHTVYGIYISKPLYVNDVYQDTSANQGLFGYAEGAVLRGINIDESFIDAPFYAGSVIGYAVECDITDCTCGGTVTGGSYSGGIAGYSEKGRIADCLSTCTVGADDRAGGIVGSSEYGEVRGCVNLGPVNGTGEGFGVGGIAGQNFGSITKCRSLGPVNSLGSIVGGIVGRNGNYIDECSVTCCFSLAPVTGSYLVGGAVGSNSGRLENCYNTGAVTGGADMDIVGGIVGYSYFPGTVKCCYNTGTVSGGPAAGAVIGYDEYGEPGVVESCFFLDTCGSVGGAKLGTALTDGQLRSREGYAGFDFDNVWTMDGSPEYFYAELIGLPHSTEEAPNFPDGDVDGDGEVTVSDALAIMRCTLGLLDADGLDLSNADVNIDGAVDTSDALLVLRIALRLITV